MTTMALMHGCGNKFILSDEYKKEEISDKVSFVKKICAQPKFNDIDSVLFLLNSSSANISMRIFDRDGTEETMCGNGIRCTARYYFDNYLSNRKLTIETLDGIKKAKIIGNQVEINLGNVRHFQKLNTNTYYVYIGCPHIVIAGCEFSTRENMAKQGRSLCHDNRICNKIGIPNKEGVYINFLQKKEGSYRLITYERHVERLTDSCGTGNAAAAYVIRKIFQDSQQPIQIMNRGGILETSIISEEIYARGTVQYI